MDTTTTIGPLGFPVTEDMAKQLDELLKTIPSSQREYARKSSFKSAPAIYESDSERSDVSWITTEDLDIQNEVMIAKGMDETYFNCHPMVTMAHLYDQPPVGRSEWRKHVKEGTRRGVKAKTIYPRKPDGYTGPWNPDAAFAMLETGLLGGKSVGFLVKPGGSHYAEPAEAKKLGCLEGSRIIDAWWLMEYAACSMPINPAATVEEINKSGIPFTSEQELLRLAERLAAAMPWNQAAEDAIAKAFGRI